MRLKGMGIIGLVTLALLFAPFAAVAQQAVFLVRHAEQSVGVKDPPLTEAGERRATALATVLRDAGINVIYISERGRTIQTAEPLAKALNVEIKTMPRRDIHGLVGRLRTQHAHDRVLVVSHSLTVPALLKALGHPGEVTIARDEYDSLFVIVPKNDGGPVVLRLRF